MSVTPENSTDTTAQPEQVETPESPFVKYMRETGLPEMAWPSIVGPLETAWELTRKHNARVASVQAAKKGDKNNVEYLDSLWKLHATDDPEIAEIEPRYQEVVDEYEKLLKQLREAAKKHIPEQLSETEIENTKKMISSGQEAIEKSLIGAEIAAGILDNLLTSQDKEVPGGSTFSLIPEMQTLRKKRETRQSDSGEKRFNITRSGEILIGGKSTRRGDKSNFAFAADALTQLRKPNVHPGNEVTAEMLEDAFFASLGYPKGEEGRKVSKEKGIPDKHTFKFSKPVFTSDDGKKEESFEIEVTYFKKNPNETAKPEAATEKPAETKPAENSNSGEQGKKPGPKTQELLDAQKKQQEAQAKK